MYLLSAVIITYNEELNIGRCIEALKNVADEIVVVDSYSTDRTLEICDDYKVRVIQRVWEGFGKQKKFAVETATYENIIALDADEVLDPIAINEIKGLKESGFKGVYELKLHHYYFGKFLSHGQEYPNYKKRIFNRSEVNWNENKVHESLMIPLGYPVLRLKGRIDHYTYLSIEQFIQKSNLYTTLGAQELYDRGKRSYMMKMIMGPSFTFFQSYFLKAGMLDGMHGFVMAFLNSYVNFLKYAKLWRLCK